MKVIVVLLIVQSIYSIFAQEEETNECYNLRGKSCSNCLEIPGCVWCSYTMYNGSRCNTATKHLKAGCPSDHTINPKGNSRLIGNTSQMTPERAVLTVRVGEPVTFQVEVQPAQDYPVDLYYLMDLSHSMDGDLQTLKVLAADISTKLSELTSKHRLAFGSFVDKDVPPFLKQEHVGIPYKNSSDYAVPYDFKHVANFTDDKDEFKQIIGFQRSSGSRDTPEGTMDALMQVAVCEQELDWNPYNSTRRMVLIATDAPFHLAGEGKFGGVVKPYDGKCHLKYKDGVLYYSKSLEMDYPSANQVYRALQRSRIQPIFAISSRSAGAKDVFEHMKDIWKNLSPTNAYLDKRSQNIVGLIEESYKKIISTVQVTYEAQDGITVDIQNNCGKKGAGSNQCVRVGLGEKVSFDINVTATTCKNGNFSRLKIVATGFGEVNVDVNIICSCACEDKKDFNASLCSGNGTLVCGQCDCNPGRTGQRCECDESSAGDQAAAQCIMPNSTLSCDGNGECVCGECQCNPVGNRRDRYYGEYCQCDDQNCEQYRGELCGGDQRGVCKCNKCKCKKGYIGSNCGKIDCSLKMADCLDDNQVNCSGHGECDCGECKCHHFYQGPLCNECPSCQGRCGNYQQCVLCRVFGEVPYNETLCADCPPIEIKNSREELNMLGLLELCEYKDDEGCTYLFTYGNTKENETITIFAVKEKDCPEGPNVLLIVLSVVGGILAIGLLLLLLWKLLTAMVDQREYQKFIQDRAKSKWHRERNPLYKPATTSVQNPTYTGEATKLM